MCERYELCFFKKKIRILKFWSTFGGYLGGHWLMHWFKKDFQKGAVPSTHQLEMLPAWTCSKLCFILWCLGLFPCLACAATGAEAHLEKQWEEMVFILLPAKGICDCGHLSCYRFACQLIVHVAQQYGTDRKISCHKSWVVIVIGWNPTCFLKCNLKAVYKHKSIIFPFQASRKNDSMQRHNFPLDINTLEDGHPNCICTRCSSCLKCSGLGGLSQLPVTQFTWCWFIEIFDRIQVLFLCFLVQFSTIFNDSSNNYTHCIL